MTGCTNTECLRYNIHYKELCIHNLKKCEGRIDAVKDRKYLYNQNYQMKLRKEQQNVTQPTNTELIKTIVDTLNSVCGTEFKATTKATGQRINARLKEGFTLDDFRNVICFKNDQWKDDPKMAQYLQPDTLFGTKFEGYLQASKRVFSPKDIMFGPEILKTKNIPIDPDYDPELAL